MYHGWVILVHQLLEWRLISSKKHKVIPDHLENTWHETCRTTGRCMQLLQQFES